MNLLNETTDRMRCLNVLLTYENLKIEEIYYMLFLYLLALLSNAEDR